MSTWDATLPKPLLTSYHNSDTLPILKTEMESGPPRRVRYSNHYMTRGQMSMVLDKTQMTAFQAMVVASNLTADWLTDCPIDTGGGLTNHRIRMTSIQRKVLVPPDKTWSVTVAFETDEHESV